MSKKVIERMALSAFTIGSTSVANGEIIKLDDLQFDRAVAAGCVHKDEGADQAARSAFASRVSTVAIKAATAEPSQAVRVSGAQAAADAQINKFDQMVADKRNEASTAISEIDKEVADARVQADKELEAIRQEVSKTRAEADAELVCIAQEVTDARLQADKDLAAIAEEVDNAKKSGKEK
ncbi:hypothetical protein [Brucella intermedia]|uniref:hypothetical protein n=1 Tax=Brucella intermedia TaxID=94625 RepID=UPI00124D2A9F|nr:hypothetical protein [Brucella intermedia]KAB2730727.1 hypothetical protein F9L02_11805 [Brucella intermedia]